MSRIIDISNKDGNLWVEDEGYLSDFVENIEYLFSIEIPDDNANCRVFKKSGFEFANNVFFGVYYITISNAYDAELHCTKDKNCYVEWNINDDANGEYISPDYYETLILNLDNMTASCSYDSELEMIVVENESERESQREHERQERTY